MEYNVYSADRLGKFTRIVGFFVQKNVIQKVYEKEYKVNAKSILTGILWLWYSHDG